MVCFYPSFMYLGCYRMLSFILIFFCIRTRCNIVTMFPLLRHCLIFLLMSGVYFPVVCSNAILFYRLCSAKHMFVLYEPHYMKRSIFLCCLMYKLFSMISFLFLSGLRSTGYLYHLLFTQLYSCYLVFMHVTNFCE